MTPPIGPRQPEPPEIPRRAPESPQESPEANPPRVQPSQPAEPGISQEAVTVLSHLEQAESPPIESEGRISGPRQRLENLLEEFHASAETDPERARELLPQLLELAGEIYAHPRSAPSDLAEDLLLLRRLYRTLIDFRNTIIPSQSLFDSTAYDAHQAATAELERSALRVERNTERFLDRLRSNSRWVEGTVPTLEQLETAELVTRISEEREDWNGLIRDLESVAGILEHLPADSLSESERTERYCSLLRGWALIQEEKAGAGPLAESQAKIPLNQEQILERMMALRDRFLENLPTHLRGDAIRPHVVDFLNQLIENQDELLLPRLSQEGMLEYATSAAELGEHLLETENLEDIPERRRALLELLGQYLQLRDRRGVRETVERIEATMSSETPDTERLQVLTCLSSTLRGSNLGPEFRLRGEGSRIAYAMLNDASGTPGDRARRLVLARAFFDTVHDAPGLRATEEGLRTARDELRSLLRAEPATVSGRERVELAGNLVQLNQLLMESDLLAAQRSGDPQLFLDRVLTGIVDTATLGHVELGHETRESIRESNRAIVGLEAMSDLHLWHTALLEAGDSDPAFQLEQATAMLRTGLALRPLSTGDEAVLESAPLEEWIAGVEQTLGFVYEDLLEQDPGAPTTQREMSDRIVADLRERTHRALGSRSEPGDLAWLASLTPAGVHLFAEQSQAAHSLLLDPETLSPQTHELLTGMGVELPLAQENHLAAAMIFAELGLSGRVAEALQPVREFAWSIHGTERLPERANILLLIAQTFQSADMLQYANGTLGEIAALDREGAPEGIHEVAVLAQAMTELNDGRDVAAGDLLRTIPDHPMAQGLLNNLESLSRARRWSRAVGALRALSHNFIQRGRDAGEPMNQVERDTERGWDEAERLLISGECDSLEAAIDRVVECGRFPEFTCGAVEYHLGGAFYYFVSRVDNPEISDADFNEAIFDFAGELRSDSYHQGAAEIYQLLSQDPQVGGRAREYMGYLGAEARIHAIAGSFAIFTSGSDPVTSLQNLALLLVPFGVARGVAVGAESAFTATRLGTYLAETAPTISRLTGFGIRTTTEAAAFTLTSMSLQTIFSGGRINPWGHFGEEFGAMLVTFILCHGITTGFQRLEGAAARTRALTELSAETGERVLRPWVANGLGLMRYVATIGGLERVEHLNADLGFRPHEEGVPAWVRLLGAAAMDAQMRLAGSAIDAVTGGRITAMERAIERRYSEGEARWTARQFFPTLERLRLNPSSAEGRLLLTSFVSRVASGERISDIDAAVTRSLEGDLSRAAQMILDIPPNSPRGRRARALLFLYRQAHPEGRLAEQVGRIDLEVRSLTRQMGLRGEEAQSARRDLLEQFLANAMTPEQVREAAPRILEEWRRLQEAEANRPPPQDAAPEEEATRPAGYEDPTRRVFRTEGEGDPEAVTRRAGYEDLTRQAEPREAVEEQPGDTLTDILRRYSYTRGTHTVEITPDRARLENFADPAHPDGPLTTLARRAWHALRRAYELGNEVQRLEAEAPNSPEIATARGELESQLAVIAEWEAARATWTAAEQAAARIRPQAGRAYSLASELLQLPVIQRSPVEPGYEPVQARTDEAHGEDIMAAVRHRIVDVEGNPPDIHEIADAWLDPTRGDQGVGTLAAGEMTFVVRSAADVPIVAEAVRRTMEHAPTLARRRAIRRAVVDVVTESLQEALQAETGRSVGPRSRRVVTHEVWDRVREELDRTLEGLPPEASSTDVANAIRETLTRSLDGELALTPERVGRRVVEALRNLEAPRFLDGESRLTVDANGQAWLSFEVPNQPHARMRVRIVTSEAHGTELEAAAAERERLAAHPPEPRSVPELRPSMEAAPRVEPQITDTETDPQAGTAPGTPRARARQAGQATDLPQPITARAPRGVARFRPITEIAARAARIARARPSDERVQRRAEYLQRRNVPADEARRQAEQWREDVIRAALERQAGSVHIYDTSLAPSPETAHLDGATVDHHGRFGNELNATEQLLILMESARSAVRGDEELLQAARGDREAMAAALEGTGRNPETARAEDVEIAAAIRWLNIREVTTDNLADGGWCVWIARHQARILRDPALRELIDQATHFEDFTAFGTGYSETDPGIRLQAALFQRYGEILRTHGIRGSDRFPPEQSEAVMTEALRAIDDLLGAPGEAAPPLREELANTFFAEVERARQVAAERAVMAEGSVHEGETDMTFFDLTALGDFTVFQQWLALPRVTPRPGHPDALQVSVVPMPPATNAAGESVSRRLPIVAIPNGRELPSGRGLLSVLERINAAEQARAAELGIDPPNTWFGKDNVILPNPARGGSVLTPAEISTILRESGLFEPARPPVPSEPPPPPPEGPPPAAEAPVEGQAPGSFLGYNVGERFAMGLSQLLRGEPSSPFVDFNVEGARVLLWERNFAREQVPGFDDFRHIPDRHAHVSGDRGDLRGGRYARDVDIERITQETLRNYDRIALTFDEQGRPAFQFQRTFDRPVGTTSTREPTSTVQVVLSQDGEVTTSFPAPLERAGRRGWVARSAIEAGEVPPRDLFIQASANPEIETRHAPFLPNSPNADRSHLYQAQELPVAIVNSRTVAVYRAEAQRLEAGNPDTEPVTNARTPQRVRVRIREGRGNSARIVETEALVAEMRFSEPVGEREVVGPDGQIQRVPLFWNRTYFRMRGDHPEFLGGYPIAERGEAPVAEAIWNPIVRGAQPERPPARVVPLRAPRLQVLRVEAGTPRAGEDVPLEVVTVRIRTSEGEREITARLDPLQGQREANLRNAFRAVRLEHDYPLEGGGQLRFTGNILGQGSASTIFEAVRTSATGETARVAVKVRTHVYVPEAADESGGRMSAEERRAHVTAQVEGEQAAQRVLAEIDPSYSLNGILAVEGGSQGVIMPLFDPANSTFFTHLSELPEPVRESARAQLESFVEEMEGRGHSLGDVEFVYDRNTGRVHLVDPEGVILNMPGLTRRFWLETLGEESGREEAQPAVMAEAARRTLSPEELGRVGGEAPSPLAHVVVGDTPFRVSTQREGTSEVLVFQDDAGGATTFRISMRPGESTPERVAEQVEALGPEIRDLLAQYGSRVGRPLTLTTLRNLRALIPANPGVANPARTILETALRLRDGEEALPIEAVPLGDTAAGMGAGWTVRSTGEILGIGSGRTVFRGIAIGPDSRQVDVAVAVFTHPMGGNFTAEARNLQTFMENGIGEVRLYGRTTVGGSQALVTHLATGEPYNDFGRIPEGLAREAVPILTRDIARAAREGLDLGIASRRDTQWVLGRDSDGRLRVQWIDLETVVPVSERTRQALQRRLGREDLSPQDYYEAMLRNLGIPREWAPSYEEALNSRDR